MQKLGDNTIQRIDWPKIFPAVLIPRAFKYALGGRTIFLGFLGLAISSFFATFFIEKTADNGTQDFSPTAENVATEKLSAEVPLNFVAKTTDRIIPSYTESMQLGAPSQWRENFVIFSKYEFREESTILVSDKVAHPWMQFSATGWEVFSHRYNSFFKSLLWFGILAVIWSFIGGAMTRIAALRFAQERRENFVRQLNFVRIRWRSYLGVIILPVAGIFCVMIPVWLLGWIGGLVSGGETTASYIGHIIYLVLTFPFALAAVLIMIGFLLSWPLMFAAVSSEGSDAFDAVSRGFSYVYQRPVQFVFYHMCNLVIYTICTMIAYFVFHETVKLIGYDPAGLMIIFNSFAFAYFWSSSTVIYFLLRRSCDATPFDQIYLGKVIKRTMSPIVTSTTAPPEMKTGE